MRKELGWYLVKNREPLGEFMIVFPFVIVAIKRMYRMFSMQVWTSVVSEGRNFA